VEDQRKEKTYENASRKGEIEGKIFAFDRKVAGELAEPGDLDIRGEENTQNEENEADNDEKFAQSGKHGLILSQIDFPKCFC
jgi:hypothetical protein